MRSTARVLCSSGVARTSRPSTTLTSYAACALSMCGKCAPPRSFLRARGTRKATGRVCAHLGATRQCTHEHGNSTDTMICMRHATRIREAEPQDTQGAAAGQRAQQALARGDASKTVDGTASKGCVAHSHSHACVSGHAPQTPAV